MKFYDLNAKINYKISDKDRIFLSGYFGKDKLYSHSEAQWIYEDIQHEELTKYGLFWGNATAAFRWNHIYGSKLFSNTSVIYSNYRYNNFDMGWHKLLLFS